MAKQWLVRGFDRDKYDDLIDQGYQPELAYLLTLHPVKNPQHFLKAGNEQEFDPFLFKDMRKVVTRLQQASQNHEHALIYGDYDTDGITSTAIMDRLLTSLNIPHDCFLPKRSDGYGPNQKIYEELVTKAQQANDPYRLWITVDNGIQGKKEITYLNQNHIDCIITDHHTINPDNLSPAFAIIHPEMPDSGYPEAILSGAGVAFKVMEAVNPTLAAQNIDLAAVGIVGDVMDLTSENRIIVARGLQKLRTDGNLGLQSLIKVGGNANLSTLTSTDLSFSVVPALNACGRLKSPDLAFQLVQSQTSNEAESLARQLLDMNQLRKDLTNEYFEQAIQQLNPQNKCNIIQYPSDVNRGLAGLVANKLVEYTGKPTIVVVEHEDGEYVSGSCRSIEGLNLEKILKSLMPSIVHSTAGHPEACVVSLLKNNLPILQTALNQLCHSVNPGPLLIDCQIKIQDLARFQKASTMFAPFGKGNPNFRILTRIRVDQCRHLGQNKDTIKLIDNDYPELEFIGFKDYQDVEFESGSIVDVVGTVSLHIWRDKVTVQFIIDDLSTPDKEEIDYATV